MKNFLIFILLIVIGCQWVNANQMSKDFKQVQEDYINLRICIEEGLL